MDGGSLRLCHEADATPHQIDLRACNVDDVAKDWILRVDVPNKLLTDAIMGDLWQHDALLSRAKDNWAGGKYLPSVFWGRFRHCEGTRDLQKWRRNDTGGLKVMQSSPVIIS